MGYQTASNDSLDIDLPCVLYQFMSHIKGKAFLFESVYELNFDVQQFEFN